ncbi:MAG: hypothetical protein EHM28_02600 [Spirochaetaceae bacterium]|nr:MAG: hypothetical protein EHM28_02600 [Spirochaetaceae bacterium]
MLEGLSKQISGDWADLQQVGLQPENLAAYFHFSNDDLSVLVSGLAGSYEQGIVEYKYGLLLPLFAGIEDIKFKNISLDELSAKTRAIDLLLFLCSLQRAVCSSGLAVRPEETEDDATSIDAPEIKLILADVMNRIKENPEAKNNNLVKMILTQLVIYQKERETMQKLAPNIKDLQKRKLFLDNFRTTFSRISESIRKYYTDLVSSEQKRERQIKQEQVFSLTQLPLKEMLTHFTKQAREISRIRSTISFALAGRYKVREILLRVYGEKESMQGLLDKELEAFGKAGKGVLPPLDAERVSIAWAQELKQIILQIS